MVFFAECVIACAGFTLLVAVMTAKKREVFANDYPPVVTDQLRKLGFIAEKPPARKTDLFRKGVVCTVYAVLFALLLRFVNGITDFWHGTLTAFALWLVVDWYDFLVIDVLLAPFDRFYRATKVSAFDKSAVWFHFKGSVKGTILGIVFAPIVGLMVALVK